MLFKTYTKADGTKETRCYSLPRREDGKFGYERKSPLTAKELACRGRFSRISYALQALTEEKRAAYAKEWKKAGYKFNGKKYATLRGYIMARMYANMVAVEKCTAQKSDESPLRV
jgi:hypothetical protein